MGTLDNMIWLVIFIKHFWTVHTYENIAVNRPAWQRYPYHGTPWNAILAVDGRRLDLSARGGQCAISANSRSIAEWRVDLGEIRNLHHVFIQYRTENVAWDENNTLTSRFLGFSIYVSKTTHRKDWKLCFKDNNYTRATIPNPLSVTCLMHGRYVIYYNNRTHRPFPAGYSTYAFNELCEVEVYGCLKLGYYGENCSTPCPENCENGDCDIVDGTCISCVPGYKGSMCNKACEGKYGMNCSKVCGACYEKEQCDYKNGTCPSGCEDGYNGRQCKTVCNNNTYGPNCSMTCGHCIYLYGEKCNHVTGQCPRGCAPGFQGDLCVESIDEFKNKTTVAWPTYNGCLKVGYYGENCSTPCPENCENGYCDIVDGTCISCVPGYKGSMCNKVCNNNTYGPNCSKTCGHCIYLYGEKCNHVTGQCPRGCASGFQGDLCVESRDEFKNKTTVAWPTFNGCLKLGYYGENCSTPCPENCENGDCDIVDGTCNSCVPGYRGSMCNKACEGKYGMNCSKVCGACYEKEQCDYKNGTCPSGCEDGYKGRQCKTVCKNNTYGPNCSRTCGHCVYLYGEKCNHVTGQCPRGCAPGFQGDLCVESRDEFKNKTMVAWPTYTGCLKVGYYGENCSTPCPENCENGDCDIVDGICISCVPGYRGYMCNKVCNNNTYGPNCSRTCGHCVYLYGEKCNHVTGQCPRGCASGFQGDLCVESRVEFKNMTTVAWPTYTGCLKEGYYGENCSTLCPENCENGDCDIVDGTCISCVPGYRGSMCNKVCNNNTYGPNCSRTCGHCVYLYGEKCNHVTGQCPRGCASGFQGDLCVESRDEFKNKTTIAWPTYNDCLKVGYYGENCSTPCPENCENGDCDIVDGTCISCVPGYRGSMCNKVCNSNTYGPNCSRTCGHCLYLYGEKCNHVTGQCPRGCASGFQGDICVESRDEFKNKTTVAWPTYNGCLKLGYYGENCSTPCPENCENGDCDIVDGTCISCVPGYRGSMCNKACEGKYGMNCSKVCGACYEKEQCDYKNGTCPSGCEDGYKGRQCKTVCNNNTYGPNCSRTCGDCLYLYGEKCNHVTGQCPRGCASGFQGDLCVESRDEVKNETMVAWPVYNAHGPPVSQTTVQVPFYSIVTVVVLFSGSVVLNLIFISRKALLRCRNRDKKVDESVEMSDTYVYSIYVLENGCAAHQELEDFDKNENDDIYTYVE
ncbi:multiple epidermal growth factor-like domains protein 11 isoform X1 [Magallana gigas]|uniref:multiple epidermal growth factor-like domains protein 11 isoform X1 n=1 Tax=Magallana gigas TaxID=29159 RepID=UPI0033408C6B